MASHLLLSADARVSIERMTRDRSAFPGVLLEDWIHMHASLGLRWTIRPLLAPKEGFTLKN